MLVFPWSMSDFKPGDRNIIRIGVCTTGLYCALGSSFAYVRKPVCGFRFLNVTW